MENARVAVEVAMVAVAEAEKGILQVQASQIIKQKIISFMCNQASKHWIMR